MKTYDWNQGKTLLACFAWIAFASSLAHASSLTIGGGASTNKICATNQYATLETECAALGAFAADEFEGYAKREMAEAVDLDAFENHAFEDVSKFGKVNKNIELGKFGYNGNGGMRERPFGKKLIWKLPFKGRLEKGQRYVYSADVRPHGKIHFQTCCDVWQKSPRKYAFGAYGPKSTPLGDGWRHQEVEFIAKDDPENLEYTFMVFALSHKDADPDDPEVYVDVDNIAIRLDAPKWYLCNTWPTHNKVYSENARVRCNSTFWGKFLDDGADAVYAFRLLAADGRELAKRIMRADEKGNMTADFGKLDYEGPATLSVTLYDKHAKLNLGTRTIALTAAKTPDKAKGLFVQENGVVLKGGKPFMPLGFYASLAYRNKYTREQLETELKRMHDSGFDSIIDYGTYTLPKGNPRDTYYGLCEKYGVNVLADDFKITGKFDEVDAKMPIWRERAEDLVRYPAVMGFYNMDEGTENFVEPLTKMRRMLNEIAPNHMVYICNIMRAAPYLPIADIQGGDSYPVKPNKPHSMLSSHLQQKAIHDCAPAAIWWAPQAYNWAEMVHGAMDDAELFKRAGREPQENEMLAVALLNASDGATGFFFFSHHDIFRCPVKEWIPQRWERMCRVGKVMRSMEPFIMSGCPVVDVPHKDAKGQTRVAAMTDGKGAWRVIVVGLEEDHETRFTLPAEYGELKVRCGFVAREGDEYVFRAKEYSCDLLE